MAQLALGIAGAAIGFAIGGPAGAQAGFAIGTAAGGALFPPKMPDGPRLQDRAVQVSTYGAEIPRIYGTTRLAGNIIWSTDLLETANEQSGKGGPSFTTYSYSVSCAVSICRGEITGIRKIWADGLLIYDVSEENDGPQKNFTATGFKTYLGSETQMPDPTIEAIMGTTPAYRGQAYVVFENFQLEKFGNRIPNFTFEAANGYIAPRTFNPVTTSNIDSLYLAVDPGSGYIWRIDNGRASGIQVVDPIAGTVVATLTGSVGMTGPQPYRNLSYNPADRTFVAAGGFQQTPNPEGGSDLIFNIVDIWSADAMALIKSFQTEDDGLFGSNQNYVFANPDFPCYITGSTVGAHNFIRGYTSNGIKLFIYDTGHSNPEGGVIPQSGVFYCGDGRFFDFYDSFSMSLIARIDNSATYASQIGARPKITYDTLRNRLLWTSSGTAYTIIELSTFTVTTGTLSLAPDVSSITTWTYHSKTDTVVASCPGAVNTLVQYDAETFEIIKVIEEDGLGGLILGGIPMMVEAPYFDDRLYTAFGTAYKLYLTDSIGLASIPLSEVIEAESAIVGLEPADLDVTDIADIEVLGYAITSASSIRGAIEPLMIAYFVEAVESNGKMKFTKRSSAPTITIDEDDIGYHDFGTQSPEPLPLTRADEVELPRSVTIKYQNRAADYQVNTQAAYRLTANSKNDMVMDVPIVLTDQQAKNIADTGLYSAWASRTSTTVQTSIKYAQVEPGDKINVNNNIIRVLNRTLAGNIITLQGSFENGSIYTQSGIANEAFDVGQTIRISTNTVLQLMDIPMLLDQDNNAGFYVAACGQTEPWDKAVLFKSIDGGTSWVQISALSNKAIIGAAQTALGSFESNLFDDCNTVDVILRPGSSLFSVTTEAILNGANAALIGNEVLQFKTVTQIDENVYRLSGLLRGRRGTSTLGHSVGDRFVFLTEASIIRIPMDSSEVGLERLYKAVTLGKTIDSAITIPFTNTANGLECYSPVKLSGGRDTAGNIQINWVRRTRVNGAWRDLVDVPVAEETQEYTIKIYDGSTLVRTLTSTTPTVTYTDTDQVTDFGSTQSSVLVKVYQNSATNGIGYEVSGSV
jgi:hypothetical protein